MSVLLVMHPVFMMRGLWGLSPSALVGLSNLLPVPGHS